MNINPVNSPANDKNRYCGPAAISILTGMTTGEAARMIRQSTDKALVKGTHASDLFKVLYRCGLSYRTISVPTTRVAVKRKANFAHGAGIFFMDKGELTLAQWLKESVKLRTAGRVFLVAAGQHWQIITGRRYCCGITKQIVSITDKLVKRRARVTEVYEILLRPGKTITIPDRAKKPKSAIDPHLRRLNEFLKGVDMPKGKLVWDCGVRDYVIPPCKPFPKGFSTMHHDWAETLGRVMHCWENPDALDEDGHYSE
jgi:hypothetical protein